MNANDIITKDMSLDDKLAAIDAAMVLGQQQADENRRKAGLPPLPVDPSDLTMCEGCQ